MHIIEGSEKMSELLDVKEVFGKQLKRLRESHGMMQQELADRIKVKRTSISNYETGKQSPDLAAIKRIAELFNTTVDELLHETNEVADKTIEQHNELMLDLESGLPLDEIAAKNKIYVDGVELPIEQKKAILEQIEFQYRKWQESI